MGAFINFATVNLNAGIFATSLICQYYLAFVIDHTIPSLALTFLRTLTLTLVVVLGVFAALTYDLQLFIATTRPNRLALVVDIRESRLTNAGLVAILVVIVAFNLADFIMATIFNMLTLMVNEGISRLAHASLATTTITISIVPVAVVTLGLGDLGVFTLHNGFTIAVDSCEAVLTNTCGTAIVIEL